MSDQFQNIFPRAFSEPVGTGSVKQFPEDFIVNEMLAFSFSGEGEHVYLRIRKTNQNTAWVVEKLAKHFSSKERDIGYAGLKDRHAVTTQWFSLLAKFATPEKIETFLEEGIEIVDIKRHTGKLRKGAISCNEFRIMVRDLDVNETELVARLQLISSSGVPNYFDEQRFGNGRQNLDSADKVFKGKLHPKRSKQRIYQSAARSWLFNLILAKRIRENCWATGVDGDVFMLDGSRKYFHADHVDEKIEQRLIEKDIHPTAALWGEGQLQTTDAASRLELSALDDWRFWCRQLEKARMKQQRRACRVIPADLAYKYNKKELTLELSFSLPAGAYATNVLREIIKIDESRTG